MNRRACDPLLLVALACLTALVLLPGCGGGPDPRPRLEGIIRTQLPQKLKDQIGAVSVQAVTCTKAGGNKYDCVATIVGAGENVGLKRDVSIDATCDERSCTWRTAGGSGPTPSQATRAPSGQAKEAMRARLERGGYTITEEMPGRSAEGDQGTFATEATNGTDFRAVFFESDAAATREANDLRKTVVQVAPSRAAVETDGSVLYIAFAGEGSTVPRDEFKKFVAAAKG